MPHTALTLSPAALRILATTTAWLGGGQPLPPARRHDKRITRQAALLRAPGGMPHHRGAPAPGTSHRGG